MNWAEICRNKPVFECSDKAARLHKNYIADNGLRLSDWRDTFQKARTTHGFERLRPCQSIQFTEDEVEAIGKKTIYNAVNYLKKSSGDKLNKYTLIWHEMYNVYELARLW